MLFRVNVITLWRLSLYRGVNNDVMSESRGYYYRGRHDVMNDSRGYYYRGRHDVMNDRRGFDY